jgi:hypothetical protein
VASRAAFLGSAVLDGKEAGSMSRSRRGALAHMLAALSPAAALLATASAALADWQDDLAAQLRWDHECVV